MAESGGKELVGLKVSVPLVPGVISAEIPIRWSLLRPLMRVFHKAQPQQLVRVVGARGFVHVHADDEGTVDVYLQTVNMTDRPLRVDDLHLDLFYIGGVTTAAAQPLFRTSERPIAPFDADEVYVTINLGSAAIRGLLQRTRKAQNLFSSPGVELTVGGTLHLFIPGSFAALQRARAIRLPFSVVIRQLEMNVNCPAAAAAS